VIAGPVASVLELTFLFPRDAAAAARVWRSGIDITLVPHIKLARLLFPFEHLPPEQPYLTLLQIALDVTHQVPVASSFLKQLSLQARRAASSGEASSLSTETLVARTRSFDLSALALDLWRLAGCSDESPSSCPVGSSESAFTYCFWDTLTALAVLRPELIRTEDVCCLVDHNPGPCEGRIRRAEPGESTAKRVVQVAKGVDASLVYDTMLRLLRG
jgi:hypothetical protein